MLGNPMLEVAIALGFFYAVLSLVCFACTEAVSNFLSLRARGLRESISRMFGEASPGADSARVLNHPLNRSLGPRRSWKAIDGVPDHVPGEAFARVLMDILPETTGSDGEKTPTTIDELCGLLDRIQPPALKKSLLSFLPDAGDLDTARKRIEAWFDNSMDRARGWYARRAQWITLAAAALVVGWLNADTLMMTEVLRKNGNVRAVIVAEAENATGGGAAAKALSDSETEAALSLFPLGWHGVDKAGQPNQDPRVLPTSAGGLLRKLVGLLITTLAVSLGAPFWFDLLSRLVNLRSAGKPLPTASDKQAAETAARS